MVHWRVMTVVALLLFLFQGCAVGAKEKEDQAFAAFEKKIRGIVNREKGKMDIGFSFLHIEKGERLSIRGEKPYALASVFKVPILVGIMKKIDTGELKLSTPVVVNEQDKCIGSGTLKNVPAGTTVTVGKCIELMITISDNTATDLLWNLLGYEKVRELMKELGLNATNIYIPNRPGYLISLGLGSEFRGKKPREIAKLWESKSMPERRQSMMKVLSENRNLTVEQFGRIEDASAAGQKGSFYYDDVKLAEALDNFSSPDDMAALLALLYRGELLSKSSTAHCLYVMGNTKYNSRIPGDLPPGVRVFHKTGTICGIVNDMGIIEVSKRSHAVVVVFVNNIEETRGGEAGQVIAILARAVYDYCSGKKGN